MFSDRKYIFRKIFGNSLILINNFIYFWIIRVP